MFLKFWKFHKKTPVPGSLFNKVAGLKAYNFIRKALQRRWFFYGIFENFKNTCFEEHLRTTAPECLRKISPLLVLGKSMLEGKIHNWATNTFYWKYEPNEVILCDIQVYQNVFSYFFQASEERTKVIMITILKYFEPPIAVTQL